MHLKNNKPCPKCGRFAGRNVTVDAVIIKNGKILLIKRGSEPFKGYWALPGGYIEWDETVEDSVKREVLEELGVSVKSSKIIGVYSDPGRHPDQNINVAFAAEIEGNVKIGSDVDDYKWESLKSLPRLVFDHNKIIEDYLKNI